MKSLPPLPKRFQYTGKNELTIKNLIKDDKKDDAHNLLEQEVGEELLYVLISGDIIYYETRENFDKYRQAMLDHRVEYLESLFEGLDELKDSFLHHNQFEKSCIVDNMTGRLYNELDAAKQGIDFYDKWLSEKAKTLKEDISKDLCKDTPLN